jgi:YcxB-like protein
MKFTVQVSEQDYMNAQRLHMRPGKARRVFHCLLGIILIPSLLFLAAADEYHTREPALIALGVIALVIILFVVVVPWRLRRFYREQKTLKYPFTMELNEEGVFSEGENGSGRIKWDDFYAWKQDANTILLYQARNLFNMIPCRVFASTQDGGQVIALIERKLEKKRKN